jgi:hypothetical protein
MREYFDLPDQTRDTITPEGWIRTGDLGSVDADGFLRVSGRIKEMIVRGGENVYPREIEDCLASHADVVGVAVVGVPDTRLGEEIAAFVAFTVGQNGVVILSEPLLCLSYRRAARVRRSLPVSGEGKRMAAAFKADSATRASSAGARTWMHPAALRDYGFRGEDVPTAVDAVLGVVPAMGHRLPPSPDGLRWAVASRPRPLETEPNGRRLKQWVANSPFFD